MLDLLPEELLILILSAGGDDDAELDCKQQLRRQRRRRHRCRLGTLDILNVRAVCRTLRDVVHHNQHHLLRDRLPAAHLITV